MANRDGNAKIFIEAQLIDNFKQIASTLNTGLEKINPDIKISVETEEAKSAVEGALKSIVRMLGDPKGYIQHLDLSAIIPKVFTLLQSEMSDEDKMEKLFSFEGSLSAFEKFSTYFQMDAKTIISAIHELNDSLGDTGVQKYLEDLYAVFDYISKLKRPKAIKDSLIRSLTDSFGVGVSSDNIADALSFKNIHKEFEDVDKFALSAKEARTRLEEELTNWEQLSTGGKYKSVTTSNIVGLISRIQGLSGKEFTQYLKDKIADEKSSEASRAQAQKLLSMYTKEGGWGEFYNKWISSESKKIPSIKNIDQVNDRVAEMTRKQLEERQRLKKEYSSQLKSSQLTQGVEADQSLVYNGEKEVTQELTEQEQVRKELADKTAQEIQTIREKLVLLKEIAELEKDVVAARVESSPEQLEMEALKDAINAVTEQVNEKTSAFQTEQRIVSEVVGSEIKDLQKLKEKLAEVAGFEGEEKKTGRISKPRKKLEEQTEEQKKELEKIKKAEEELRKEAENNVRKDSILGQLRKDQEKKEQEANKAKSKATANIKTKIKSDNKKANELLNKTANEREAQALKDIEAHAEAATTGLENFGKINEQISENVNAVAEAIQREADALNAMAKTFQKFDDSKIVQQARKDKLQQDLSTVKEGMKVPQQELKDFQDSFTVTTFKKNHLDDAAKQLRNAYKDVVTYREQHMNDEFEESKLEMAKREAKFWDAYKEAQKQGLDKSNLEARRLTPESLGIDLMKNADNRKLLNDEVAKKEKVVEEYAQEIARIQNEIKQVGKTTSSKKQAKETSNETKDYQEAIQIIEKYIEAQRALVKTQEETPSNNLQAQFSPEQLEQFNTVLNNILESIGKVEQTVGTLSDKIDFSLILEQLQSLNDALKNFSSGLTFDDFKDIFTVTIDEAADKINEFKSELDLESTTAKFEEQISRMQEKIEELQVQLSQGSVQDSVVNTDNIATEVAEDVIALEEIKGYKEEISELEKANERDLEALAKSYDDIRGKRSKNTNEVRKILLEKLEDASNEVNHFSGADGYGKDIEDAPQLNYLKLYKRALEAGISRNKLKGVYLPDIYKNGTIKDGEIGSSLDDDKFFQDQLEKTTAVVEWNIEKRKKRIEELKAEIEALSKTVNQENVNASTMSSSVELTGESESFNTVSDSAEQAAESKLNFVEANKKVAESTADSIPSIQNEVDALSSIGKEDVKDNIIENIAEPIQEGMDKYDEYYERAMKRKQKRLDSYATYPSKKEDSKITEEIQLEEEKNKELERIQEARSKLFEQESDYRIEQNRQEQQRIEQEKKNTQIELEQARISEQAKAKTITEQVRLAEEARVKEQLIRQQQIKEYEKQFVDSGNGQLTFFNEDEYPQVVQEELNDIQKTVRNEAEKHPIEIPIKGQISFINNEGIEQIAQEIGKTERAILAKNSIGDFEKTFSKISGNKAFLQDTDIPTQFLKKYENLAVGKEKGTDVTANLRQLKNLGEELANVKTKLKVSFDENGKIKSIADPEEVQEALNRYAELTEKIERLKLIITAPTSQESFLLSELKKTEEEEEKVLATSEKVEAKTKKLVESKNFLSGKDIDISSLNKYFEAVESTDLDKVLSVVQEIQDVKEQINTSRNEQGVLIKDPGEVDNLINKYNGLIKILEALKVKIQLPNSTENIALKFAENAEKAAKKAENAFDKLFEKINQKGEAKFSAQENSAQALLDKYLLKDAEGKNLPVQQNADEIGNLSAVIELKNAIEEYHEAYTALIEESQKDKSLINQEAFTEASQNVDKLETRIKELMKTIRSSGSDNAIADPNKVSMFVSQIEIFLAKNPRLSAEAKTGLQSYIDTLKSGATITRGSLKQMTAGMEEYRASEEKAGNLGINIWGQMALKMREGVAFLATKFSFYQIFNQFRQGIQVIHEFDDALTEMQKVSDETISSLQRYQKTTFATADAIGASALQVQQSTADFMRLGETLKEAAKSAEAANILMNVSEFENINEATESLIAMGAAYDDLTKMNIIDKLNEVGNNYAISTAEAATALQSSASALTTAGNDMDEALALVTAGNTVVQDANKVGIKDAQR